MPDMRKQIKKVAKEHGIKVDDLLALTSSNDPFYVLPSQREKAKWFAEIWRREGRPEIHPRGLHYAILGKGYEMRNGEPYGNTEKCWGELQDGAKYARILGLVPMEPIKDEKNPDADVQFVMPHEEWRPRDVDAPIDVEFQKPEMQYESTDDFIEGLINHIVKDLWAGVNYVPQQEQPNYIEIWAEKSAVIPEDVVEEFNATARPAGGGEFSLRMCWEALMEAESQGKDLHIFLISDFDPKGLDMPKSVARKVEEEAQKVDVDAFVHHVAVTKVQCQQYTLPSTPAKDPDGTGSGAKAYKTHTKTFTNYAGQDPTEINSFLGREPQAYRDELRSMIRPFFDEDLADQMRQEERRLRKELRERVEELVEEHREQIEEARENVDGRIQELADRIEELREELGVDEAVNEFRAAVNMDVRSAVEDLEFNMPEPEVEDPVDALLDTRRDYGDQITAYKQFDIRYTNSKDDEVRD